MWIYYGVLSSNSRSQLIWVIKTFHGELIIKGANYVTFMWSSETITWPKLTTSVDTYIWAVCSSKCKSHAMNMNIWLYRHKLFINSFTNNNHDAIRFFFVKCLKILLRNNITMKIKRDDEFQKNEKMLKNWFDFENW